MEEQSKVDAAKSQEQIHSRVRKTLPALAAYAMLAPGLPAIIERSLPKEAPYRKCHLKRCEVMHNHNGGYCCAEHCKEDRSSK